MITEELMGIGSWDLPLVADVPDRIRNLIRVNRAGFAHLVITPTIVDPAAFSYSALRSQGIYVGVYRALDGDTMRGGGLALLLGDEDGKGDILASRLTLNAQTLSTWIANLLPSNGISAGTIMASGSITGDFQYVSRRAALDSVCDSAGAQWRINPNLTLDANIATTLFPYWATPRAIVAKHSSGRELGRQQIGIVPNDFANTVDLEDYTTKVYQIAREEGITVSTASAGSVPFLIPGTATAIKMERVIDGAETSTAAASSLASANLGRFDSERSAITIATPEPLVATKLKPGDGLLIWDPQKGLFDLTYPISYEGSIIWPAGVQVRSTTWPITQGMGVYLITPETSPTVIDLTPFVAWETGDSRVELAGRDAAALGGGNPNVGMAPTGDVTLKSLQSWQQANGTLSSSGTQPTLGTGGFCAYRYKRIGQTVHWRLTLVFGTGATFGTGAWFLPLPVTAETTSGLGRKVGTVSCIDVSAATEHLASVKTDGSMYAHGAALNVSATSPFTWAAGDQLDAWGTYEAA